MSDVHSLTQVSKAQEENILDFPEKQSKSESKPSITSTQQIKPASKIHLLPLAIPEHYQQKKCFSCKIGQSSSFRNTEVILIELEDDKFYCDICLQEVYGEEQAKIKRLQQQYIYYKEFETSELTNNHQFINIQTQTQEFKLLEKQVKQLEKEEQLIKQRVRNIEQQCNQLHQMVYNLQKKEDKFWQDINKFEKRALKLQEKDFIAKSEKQEENLKFDRLSRSSIVHDFFTIKIEDTYGLIHGLAIGKKPGMTEVNWEVTNSGLAHLLLAYNYLSLKYAIPYTRFQSMKINGTLSQIILRNRGYPYSICYTGKQYEKQYGQLMDALLLELSDLAQTIEQIQNIQYTEQLKLPFSIDRKQIKILDMSINPTKLEQKSRWSQWTKSMRYFLINFKHLLTISSLHDQCL